MAPLPVPVPVGVVVLEVVVVAAAELLNAPDTALKRGLAGVPNALGGAAATPAVDDGEAVEVELKLKPAPNLTGGAAAARSPPALLPAVFPKRLLLPTLIPVAPVPAPTPLLVVVFVVVVVEGEENKDFIAIGVEDVGGVVAVVADVDALLKRLFPAPKLAVPKLVVRVAPPVAVPMELGVGLEVVAADGETFGPPNKLGEALGMGGCFAAIVFNAALGMGESASTGAAAPAPAAASCADLIGV